MLSHVPISSHVDCAGDPPMYKAVCGRHQWAVKGGNRDAVEALVREHVREHPMVHCASPPAPGPFPRSTPGRWPQKWKITEIHLTNGEVLYTGECGQCPHPGWNVLYHRAPVNAYMEEHWVTAHAADHKEDHG
jgi:hypothetical protein